MIYPYTLTVHFISGCLCFASIFYLLRRVEKTRFYLVRPYFNWFLFFLFYNFLLVLPLLLLDRLTLVTGIFYNFALLFLGLAMWQAFLVALNLLVKGDYYRILLSTLYLIGVTSAVTLHFLFPEVPRATPDGKWVLWYSNQPISLFYSLFGFIAGWSFVIGCIKGLLASRLKELKLRISLFMVAGFILPFSALYYFGATNAFHIRASHFFAILGLTLFIIANALLEPKRILSHTHSKKLIHRYLEIRET